MAVSPLGWIGPNREEGRTGTDRARIVHFRKVMEFETPPEHLFLELSADSRYKLYVNGIFREEGPQKGDNQTRYFDTLDIGASLVPGKNVIVASVLIYPEAHRRGNHSLFRTDSPGLYLKGYREKKGESPDFIADGTWKMRTAPVEFYAESDRFAPLYIFERARCDNESRGMHSPGYDDSPWQSARVYTFFDLAGVLHPVNLQPRMTPFQRRRVGSFKGIKCIRKSARDRSSWESLLTSECPLEIPPGSEEIVEIDGEVERTAYLSLAMAGGGGARVTILTSECYAYEGEMNPDGFLMPRKGDRTDHVKGTLYGFTDSYEVGGAGTGEEAELYEPYWFRTFRYIRLSVVTGDEPLILKSFRFRETGYPLDRGTKVETSDPSMEKIWDISERSLRCCMHDTYEDCPFYEQLQYSMDSRNQILYTYALSADDRLARQCMEDFRRSVRADGMINCSYPSYEPNLIPGFAVYYIGMIHDHMMYFGDRELVEHHEPAVLSVLQFFRSRLTGQGIVGKLGGPNLEGPFWSFIDWTKEWNETIGAPGATRNGPLTMESLLFLLGLQYGADLMKFIGQNDLSARFGEEAERLRENIRIHCTGESGMLRDGPETEEYSQHCQVFGVLTGTLHPQEGKGFLRETLIHKEKFAQCSVAMMFYLFRALELCGLYGETDRLWDIWRDMIGKNLTTCEEDPVTSRSDCHGWGALILWELPSAVLGIRPSAPGYGEIGVNPRFGNLEWARGTVRTPRGPVKAAWKRAGDKYELELSVPRDMKVRVDGTRPEVKITLL